MEKYKVCVYAICKNESNFINRWYESVKDADYICILDTGSTDNTINEIKKYPIIYKQKVINPWRFDIARNESMKLIPKDTDICFCLDLDEVIITPDWYSKLQSIWKDNTNRLHYNYNWHLINDKPIVNYYIEKIHSLNNYEWTHPVHEVLKYNGINENVITTDLITVNHYPDSSKSRSSYLPLLELSVKEDPNDDRNIHYLGREYMYYHEWNKAIDTLERHLSLKKATWHDERCASMRFIARCYTNLNRIEEAKMWLYKAIKEAPYLRDSYIELAFLYYNLKDWFNVKKYVLKALKIKTHQKTYINESFSWNYTPYDLLAIAYYNLGNYNLSYKYAKKALKMEPSNLRLQNNLTLIKNKKESEYSC